MLALCREHRLEHRTKHIALRYFLARELQQRGQLRLAYVASEANTADIFTKALAPGDHQRFCTLLGLLALLCLTGLVTPCSPPLCLWGSFIFPVSSQLLCPEGDPDAIDIPTPRSNAEAVAGENSSQRQIAMDAKLASRKSTGTYVDEVPPPRANIVNGMWIFILKRPPGSPPTFKARYVARGFRQRQGVDFFQTFSPTPKMTTLWVLPHVAAQRDYEPHSLDFSTAFLQGDLHDEIWLRRPSGFTGMTLAALGFAPSTADPSLFLRTDTTLRRSTFSCTSFSASTSGTPRHSPLLCLLATRSQLHVQMSPCEAEIYAGAMAAQELRWLTDLGERPRSPPILYVDNKAMLALCHE
ncbi:unnamed protein product [Closterium sp. NIES-53]